MARLDSIKNKAESGIEAGGTGIGLVIFNPQSLDTCRQLLVARAEQLHANTLAPLGLRHVESPKDRRLIGPDLGVGNADNLLIELSHQHKKLLRFDVPLDIRGRPPFRDGPGDIVVRNQTGIGIIPSGDTDSTDVRNIRQRWVRMRTRYPRN